MIRNLKEIFSCFNAEGTFLSGESFGSGHIHDTFRITTSEKECDDYILQKLNRRVFKNIPLLQENVERVTAHQRMKLSLIPGSDIKRECLSLIPLKDSNITYYEDQEGEFWRLLIFISDHRSYERVDSPHKAYEGGKAVGRFQAMLSDLPGEPLHETIPFFHNIEKRLDTFHQILGRDPVNRASGAATEIAEIISREEEMKVILKLGEAGRIPLRITHNDTKFNNILFDSNDRALCLIDLDTVMPGYAHYDFGDAIRTASNKALEDEDDLSKVSMDISIFKSYTEGFLSRTRDTLNDTEKEYLAFAPLLLTYTMATRFLTDFIDGDNYYKIKYPLHNLQRTSIQIELLKSMEKQYSEMQSIIRTLKMKKLIPLLIILLSIRGIALGQDRLTAADSAKYAAYYWHSKNMFDNLPDIRGEIIFLGNSITDGGEWFELLGNKKCLNRGISGDVTQGVLLRLPGITRVKPAKVFLLIGINDIARGRSVEEITATYRLILDQLKAETPSTKVYIESVLPVNYETVRMASLKDKTKLITELNASLRVLSEEYGCTYVDLFTLMADSNNNLPEKYSLDGLHLTYAAYKVWADAIRQYVK